MWMKIQICYRKLVVRKSRSRVKCYFSLFSCHGPVASGGWGRLASSWEGAGMRYEVWGMQEQLTAGGSPICWIVHPYRDMSIHGTPTLWWSAKMGEDLAPQNSIYLWAARSWDKQLRMFERLSTLCKKSALGMPARRERLWRRGYSHWV